MNNLHKSTKTYTIGNIHHCCLYWVTPRNDTSKINWWTKRHIRTSIILYRWHSCIHSCKWCMSTYENIQFNVSCYACALTYNQILLMWDKSIDCSIALNRQVSYYRYKIQWRTLALALAITSIRQFQHIWVLHFLLCSECSWNEPFGLNIILLTAISNLVLTNSHIIWLAKRS